MMIWKKSINFDFLTVKKKHKKTVKILNFKNLSLSPTRFPSIKQLHTIDLDLFCICDAHCS